MKKIKRIAALLLAGLLAVCCAGCGGNAATAETDGLKVVSTIFPGYDWLQNLMAGTGSTPTLMMKNGVDMHSFQPTAADIVSLSDADLFLYVGGTSDQWVEDALINAQNEGIVAVDMMDVLEDRLLTETLVEGMQEDHDHDEEEHEGGYDEHVWLSLTNAQLVCAALCDALCEIDTEHAETYRSNLEAYTASLEQLDEAFTETIEEAPLDTLLFGDRFPFTYLLADYDVSYYAAFPGCSAETEASFATISFLTGKLDELSLPAVLTIDGSDQSIARTIVDSSRDKDAAILTLDSMQSVTDADIEAGASYLSIMESNRAVLEQALS